MKGLVDYEGSSSEEEGERVERGKKHEREKEDDKEETKRRKKKEADSVDSAAKEKTDVLDLPPLPEEFDRMPVPASKKDSPRRKSVERIGSNLVPPQVWRGKPNVPTEDL